MKVTISIKRKKVYALVEGISVIISQKNGGTPTYEQLWASEDEAAKLDIYYREAVSDLEKRLMEWLPESKSQYDLTGDGEDYTLTLTLHRYWPKRLKGLLANKVQDYLVHSVTAGWLNDFETVTTKQDYLEMAGSDQTDIREILLQKEFGFSETARQSETNKDNEEASTTATARQSETNKDNEEASTTATARKRESLKDFTDGDGAATGLRTADETAKTTEQRQGPGIRTTDSEAKGDGLTGTEAGQRKREQWKDTDGSVEATTGLRREDSERKSINRWPDAHYRRLDDETFADDEDSFDAGGRHRDNARIDTRADWTDWSGTHFGRDNEPFNHKRRLHHGRREE